MFVTPKRTLHSSRHDEIVRPPSRLIAAEKLPRLLRMFGVYRYDLYTWYTSWCLSPFNLFLFRLFCAVYLAMALVLGFYYGSHETTAQFFFFFTYISTFLLCCYFTLHAWHTYRLTRFSSSYFRRQADRASPYYLWLLQFLYSGCFVFHVIVVAIYWTILYPTVQQLAAEGVIELGPVAIFLDVSVHVLPIIFMLCEIAVNNRFHVYAVEIFQTLIFMACYTLWMWFGAFLFYLIRDEAWWVYPHFNFVGRGRAFLYYCVIFGLTLFGFGIMYFLHRMKQYCSGCMPPEPDPEQYLEQLRKYDEETAMSNPLTPQKRKLQLSGDSGELDSTDSSVLSSQTSNELVLTQSPSDSTGLTLFKTNSPLRLSQNSSPTRSSRTARVIHAATILQQQHQPSSPQIPSMEPLQISQLHRLFNKRPAPFPLELLKAPVLAELFLKGRALERYLQRRFDEIKQSQAETDSNGLRPLQRPFVRSSPPSVPLSTYLERLFRYCHPEPLHMLSIVAYSERLIKDHGQYVPPSGWHRFVVAAWIVAGKALLGDQYWTNLYWARVAGISVLEICSLESELVILLNWRLQIPLEEFTAAWYLVQL